MPKKKGEPARGIIILKQIALHEWVFSYPRLNKEVYDDFDDAMDWMESHAGVAKARFVRLIKDYPEFLDAYHHLALTWYRQGKLEKAAELWKQGVDFALKVFPTTFSMKKDRLPWGCIDNRPFLRLYHSYGLSLLRTGRAEPALEVFENILRMNPNDNQGARAMVVECCFELKRPRGVLDVCDKYPHDALEQLLYGKPLALFRLGELNKAKAALKMAIKYFPRVADELTKADHPRPSDYNEEHVTMWSEGQAYGYWKEHGQFWTDTPAPLNFCAVTYTAGKAAVNRSAALSSSTSRRLEQRRRDGVGSSAVRHSAGSISSNLPWEFQVCGCCGWSRTTQPRSGAEASVFCRKATPLLKD